MPSTQTLSTPHGELAFLRHGQGPAVVVIHGIGGHKEDWQEFMGALSRSHTVYAIDMLGFGGSSKSAPVITMSDQADAIEALLDAYEVTRADLVGNSVGGWVAATFAADHPGRVRRLVLVDAAGFKAMFEGPPPVDFYPRDVAGMQKLLGFVRHDPSTGTAAFAEQALADAQAGNDAEAADAVSKGMFASTRLEDIADRITASTLVVWGANDRLFPPAIADLVAARVASSRKALIPSAGHFPQLDNPEAFNAVVASFLEE